MPQTSAGNRSRSPWFAFALWIGLLAAGTPCQETRPTPETNPAKAEMFYKHRLVEDAKRTAIETLFADSRPEAQLRCKSLLARIAFDERRIADAMELWQDIAKNYAATPEGKAANELVQQWATVARSESAPRTDDPRAAVWFDAAHFWLGNTPRQPLLETTWLDEAEAAEHWLRKIIATFPGSAAAAEAMAAIVRAHLGDEGTADRPGYGALGLSFAHSGPEVQEFESAIAKAEAALGELKAAFPDSVEVPRLQYSIAHAYWLHCDEERSRPWLLKIVSEAKVETFWSHLARLRLKNWRS